MVTVFVVSGIGNERPPDLKPIEAVQVVAFVKPEFRTSPCGTVRLLTDSLIMIWLPFTRWMASIVAATEPVFLMLT